MKDTTSVSVIIPVYKAEQYIHHCLDSLLAQTFKDFEIILIDDGSPDKSGEICDSYAAADNRIKVIHKKNGGVSSARQCGIDHAVGEYTIHVDPDDWTEPDITLKTITERAGTGNCMCRTIRTAASECFSMRPCTVRAGTN